MKTILLCSSNPLLVKSLYGPLREEGFAVEETEHPARAVHRVLEDSFDCMIIDAEPFGLSAEDAARIIASIAPEMPIFCVGDGVARDDLPVIRLPADPDAIREVLHRVAA